MDESQFDLYYRVLHTLEELKIDYVIIGAFAGATYGTTRATYDVDIVVDLNPLQIEEFVKKFPPPRYYADPQQIRESIQLGILFNLIDTSIGDKVDLIPLTMKPGYSFALNNRVRRRYPYDAQGDAEAWFAKPEDVIIGKLMAWAEGKSVKHEMDIRDILVAVLMGDDPEISQNFDFSYITQWTVAFDREVESFWLYLQNLANLHIK